MRFAFCCAVLGIAACESGPHVGGFHPPGPDAAMCPATASTVVCVGAVATTCENGMSTSVVDCGLTHRVCASGLGCAVCVPGAPSCDGETITSCRADGSGYDASTTTCDAAHGIHCTDEVGCTDLCARAEEMRSNVGCEYLAVPTFNPELSPGFHFAVAIANPNLVTATVTFRQNGVLVDGTLDDHTTASVVHVGSNDVVTVRLPWIAPLQGNDPMVTPTSTIQRGGAYQLTSTVPVIVDQFNPIEYRILADCPPYDSDPSDGQCFSYSNDASLLLPTTALTGSYVAISRPSLLINRDTTRGGSPGFITVVGADEVPTSVSITAHAYVSASSDGTVAAMSPGQTSTFMLAKGDVLQLLGVVPADCPTTPEYETSTAAPPDTWYCPLGADYDLTGTEIRSPGHVEVISGHGCDFVPFDRWACDHLEEQMFPVETWDTEAVISLAKQLRGEPNLVRIVASEDGTVVSFDPPSVSAPITLGRFEYAEVTANVDVRVSATHPIAVAQFLVGQDYAGLASAGPAGVGDPSMGLAVPTAQQRGDYTFLVPGTYTSNYVNVTAATGALITLDDTRVTTWTPIGASGLSTAKLIVHAGVHHAAGDRPFALLVYGYAPYTSYLYTGGLDFRLINPPI